MNKMLVGTLAGLHYHRRSLLIFYLFFTGLTIAALSPAFSWALTALRPVTGQGAISTGGLLGFLFSPGGLLWAVATLGIAGFTLVLQQAGMTLIAASEGKGNYRLALSALWELARRFRELLGLSLVQTLTHLTLALPFLCLIALAYHLMLSPHDLYYLRLERPPVLWWFLAIAGVTGLGMFVCNGWLFLRWSLSVPLLLLDRVTVRDALTQSSQLIHGLRFPTMALLLAGMALAVALPVLFTLLYQTLGSPLLDWLPERPEVLLPVILLYAAVYILFTIAVTFTGTAAFSMLLYTVYRRASGHHPRVRPRQFSRRAPWLAWTAELLVLALAIGQAALVLDSFDQREQVTITAHRGSAFLAPENTRSAIERSIQDGADYIEIDVRQTRDGVPVLWHDADMRRVFGLDGKISDLTLAEARQRDAGSWFGKQFADERILTLDEAIDITRGRARLYVDIKPDPATPDLTANVIERLQAANAVEGTVVAAAEWQVLAEVREREPRLRTALLAQFIVGPLWQERFDILGLRQNRVNPATVARSKADGNELHVWTVNSPRAMARFIDMGVDNIITDRPGVLAELLRQRAELSDTELLIMKVRNWLR